MRKILRGIAASPGIGVGRVMVYRTEKLDGFKREIQDRQAELERLHFAVESYCQRLQERADRLSPRAGEDQAEILLVQIEIARDPYLTGQVEGRIAAFQSAEYALDSVMNQWAFNFLGSDNEVIRLRAADVQDVRDGLLRVLMGLPEADLSNLSPGTVLVAGELPPSAISALDPDAVAGILLSKGGRASHVAILARALGIPTVVGASNAVAWARNGEWAIVDGTEGEGYLSPSENELEEWRIRQERAARDREAIEEFKGRPTVNGNGTPLRLQVSISSESECMVAQELGCDGIGLLRTEYLYLDRPALPEEEEQFETYRRLARLMNGRPVTIRTLDVGSDKRLPGLSWEQEANPALGSRGIRLSRRQQELFRTQLRAILRAGAFGNVRVLVPMISGVEDLRWVREQIRECQNFLRAKQEEFLEELPVGALIETPAAVFTADLIAREADFVSVGTNDLTQYTMAVDRDDARLGYLYSFYNPAMLRAIRRTIDCARAAGKAVSMCGQAAADPLLLPLLMAFGLEEFSVQPSILLATRRRISLWTQAEANVLAGKALALTTEEEVRRLLESAQRM